MLRIFLILAGVFCLAIGGCMQKDDNRIETKSSQEKVEDDLKDYLNKKYQSFNENFEFLELTGSHMGSEEREGFFQTDSFPGVKILAQRYKESGEWIYTDNYMGYYYKEESEQEISRAVKEVVSDAKIFYQPEKSTYSPECDSDMNFNEFMKNSENYFHIVIVMPEIIPEDSQNEMMEYLRIKAVDREIRLKGVLVCTDNVSVFEKLNQENIDNYMAKESFEKSWSSQICNFSMDDHSEYLYADWR